MANTPRQVRASFLGRVPYAQAVALQTQAREGIRRRGEGEHLFLLEHPHVYTLGRNASIADLLVDPGWLAAHEVEVAECDRGGQMTYHGPGQLVGYPILNLSPDRRDIRRYVRDLQETLIRTLAVFGLVAEPRDGQAFIGVWVGEEKIASIGIHLSRWITTHGFALNVTTDLSMFGGIIPCGLHSVRMTSIERLTGLKPSLEEVARIYAGVFGEVFGREMIDEERRPGVGRRDRDPGDRIAMSQRIDLGLNAVIVAVTDEVPRILTVRRPTTIEDALPFGPLDPETDPTLERGLRRWVHEQTGLELGYVEQLYTFGDRLRDPVEAKTGGRSVSVAYLALVRERPGRGSGEARWGDVYGFLPWEDWREGRPEIIDRVIEPGIERWIVGAADTPTDSAHQSERRERSDIAFGFSGVAWDGERVLERYELLYEANLIEEARRDGHAPDAPAAPEPAWSGQIAALDHRRILASALGRLRGKLKYRPVVFELLPPRFTLFQLQRVVEALAGVRLHKQNFRRLVESGGLVEGTGRQTGKTGGRPAELFVFRREVLRERPAPGVGLPGVRR